MSGRTNDCTTWHYIESEKLGMKIMEEYQAWLKEHSLRFSSGTMHFREGEARVRVELDEVVHYLWSCHYSNIDVAEADMQLDEWLD